MALVATSSLSLISWSYPKSKVVCVVFWAFFGFNNTAYNTASRIDLESSGNGIDIPNDFLISLTFLSITFNTTPSIGLSSPKSK